VLRAQGDLAGARRLLERASGIWEKLFGPEHPDTSRSINNLAHLLQDEGDLAEAQQLYERAVVIYEKVLGPEHPDTATVRRNLVELLNLLARSAPAALARRPSPGQTPDAIGDGERGTVSTPSKGP
jgi:hypothetical protein